MSIGVRSIRGVASAPWYAWASLVAAIGAVAGLAYWYREQIESAVITAWESVISTVGLGLVPVAAWVVVFGWALAYRRSWFKHYRLWLGSAGYVIFALGFLGLFRPFDGPLAEFTADGDTTLGGGLGSAIVGSSAVLGILRALVVFVVATAIAAPRLTLDVGALMIRLLVGFYVVMLVAAKSIFLGVRRVYHARMGVRSDERGQAAREAALARNRELREALKAGGLVVSATAIGDEDSTDDEDGLVDETSDGDVEYEDVFEDFPKDEIETAVASQDIESDTEPEESAPEGARFNKFWSSDASSGREAEVEEEVRPEKTSEWSKPPIEGLVDTPEGGISQEQMAETAETVRRTLADYSVDVEIGQTRPGPTVTMYGLIPGWIRKYKQVKVTDEDGNPKLNEEGKPIVSRVETKTRVKVDSILSREKDLALALGTPSIRIETPVMGKSLVGIEVPNPTPNLVTLRGVMESKEFKKLRSTAKLPIALGKGSGGETVVIDLAKMPHLLVAGATGSGKSVCLNTIISCLLMEKTPAEMRLLLVDPKRVELTPYNGIPHLLTPVVVETDQVVSLLKGLIREMLNRYRRMEEVGVRNIDSFNRKMPDRMPYLVVAIDELADLMMSASFDVEQSLCRLAQLGRATGIHLIVATQRPSVDVLTGLIKANFPSRVSFGVTSQIDSRTILDAMGAEKLLGRGDMLYQAVDASRPERVQGVYISDKEIDDLVGFWQSTPWAPLTKVSLHTVGDEVEDQEDTEADVELESKDELLDKAIELAHQYNKLSTSLLQRRMRIGYPRAARLMDQLEDAGMVGPSEGSKSRDVIIGKV